ncbi:hypothetical protein BDZ90DRAFT_275194 [Jaminaea rosea]|uniref:AAA+ ATPase domain-containing protein n=1 Tax=Jaminaea rosea TaxID=1569628 RepID=A0A316UN73_9BASI|nr:hypothetical protein BDZ90DRAFT_275194 [Jaminaea rosea]PWN26404.1 hypothetical protein BDZ90DRAFT_275194 [Jaminaea rosea]
MSELGAPSSSSSGPAELGEAGSGTETQPASSVVRDAQRQAPTDPIVIVDDEQPQPFVVEQHQRTSVLNDDAPAAPPSGPKMFSLFQPGVRDSGASSSSRSSRGRAAKDKKVEYSDAKHAKLGLEDEEEREVDGDGQVVGGASGPSASSSSTSVRKRKGNKKAASPVPPPPAPAPLPPLSLNVKGTKGSDGPMHSFFALKRAPAGEPSSRSSTPGPACGTFATTTAKRDQRPRRLPLWPDRESIHVHPADDKTAKIGLLNSRPLPFPPANDRKGKRRAISPALGGGSRTLPARGLAHRVRSQQQGRQAYGEPSASSSSATPHLTSSLAWTDQWRPRRAEEVLDNEDAARYLRDWMLELVVTAANTPRGNDPLDPSATTVSSGSKKRGAHQTVPQQRRIQTAVAKSAPRKAGSNKRARRTGGGGGYGPGGDEVEDRWSLDDFIVYDEDYVDPEEPPLPLLNGSAPNGSLTFHASPRLTNCIVLSGPPGAGKTAAVYACAAELNFEVFELFPGMGKRGSKELHQAVGDLARNHMVSGGGTGGGAVFGRGGSKGKGTINALQAMMKGQQAESETTTEVAAAVPVNEPGSAQDQAAPVDSQSSDDFVISAGRNRVNLNGPQVAPIAAPATAATVSSSAAGNAPSASSSAARQSLILLEEVDVLSLEDDKAFWSGVVDLVASSRRPVVLTCNDLSAVPLGDLPVQEVLRFHRPSRGAVEEYLGAKMEGSKEVLAGLLRRGAKGEEEDGGLDLRQAILQLQFMRGKAAQDSCHNSPATPTTPPVPPPVPVATSAPNGMAATQAPRKADLNSLRSSWRSLDSLSFSLAYLSQPFARKAAEQVAPGVPQSLSASGGTIDDAVGPSSSGPFSMARTQLDTQLGRSSQRLATPEPSTESDALLLQCYPESRGGAGRPQAPRFLWAQVSVAGQGNVALPEQSARREEEVRAEVEERARQNLIALHPAKQAGDEGERDIKHFNSSLLLAQRDLLYLVAPLSPLWLRLARHVASSEESSDYSLSALQSIPLSPGLVLDYAPMLRSIVRIEDAEEARMRHLAAILGGGEQTTTGSAVAAVADGEHQASPPLQALGSGAAPRRVLRSGRTAGGGDVIGGPGGWERQWTLKWRVREDDYYDEEEGNVVDGCEMARRSGETWAWGLQ